MFFAALRCDGALRGQTQLFVLDDVDEAGYFYHDMVQMLGEGSVLFFPSSYRRAIRFNQKDAANEILRTEVLTRLQGETTEGLAVVTYPDAVAEKVVSRRDLSLCTIPVKVGSLFDLNLLEQKLLELGMQRTDYVYEPGQFAIRGSIVDIYSYSNETPFRVDFFGDEVDSIRTFDVQTQLSQEKVEAMTVVPEMAQTDTDYVPFFDFLPKDTVLVAHDMVYVCEKVGQIYEQGFSAQAFTEDKEAKLGSDLLRDHVMMQGEAFVRTVSAFRLVELRPQGGDIVFNTLPQPLFHKNFDLVKQEFLRLQGEGYGLNIFADSEKQIERLRDIFSSMGSEEYEQIRFEPVNKAIHEGFIDEGLKQCFFTDHQLFDRYHKYNLKSDKARKGKVALTLKEIQQFEPGDYVVHIDHGIGRFGGLVRVPENGVMVEKIKIVYHDGGTIYVSIHALHKVSKYKGKEGEPPRVSKLGSGAWERMKERVKTKVKDIARDLIRLYAKRRQERGFAYSPDGFMQHELEASFAYEDTPDQLKATQEVKADMEKERPMDRLVCGDVGFGKTEVAIRAAFKAATDGKQVAVLVPTTVLAYQHYQTFTKRLKEFPARVEYLSRARTAKQQKDILQGLVDGSVDIVIGTQKLIGKSVKFKDLGLLIIDEEQKFGVAVKEKLRQMKVNVDTLTMTATPIPRTLQFSLMGARDLSVIQTPPPNRYPIQTEVHTFSPEVFAEAINFEMSRNGQVFIVNNRINNLQSLAEMVQRYVPDARVCVGHGRMNPEELEKIVLDFMNYDYDVMISTTIVENGIDVPNANTIIINSANTYGLSDLHQMRGRVGRGNRKAFCYLIAPPMAALPDDARRRLQAIENFSDLGSGIHIAMQDLDIRGAGNMLGVEQSGFIADLGYETYQKVLNEAVAELRETEFAEMYAEESLTEDGKIQGDTFVDETNIESDIPAFLPEEYVPSSGERMALYRELDGFTEQRQIDAYRSRLTDRFGQIPEVGEELIRVMQLKWMGRRLGIEKVSLKQGRMALYMPSNFSSLYYQSEAFSKIIAYASWHPWETKLRDGDRRSLLVKDVKTIAAAVKILDEIEKN
ncbi:MAG: transcription-repair coupling factor [Bacteroidaceae bacterium]|nr:transcription-repair coupling factor [Bacteroidaceae bacterium]MBQ9640005.1 transcription-repair coupling factor [Bacteroidaceae bacterium]